MRVRRRSWALRVGRRAILLTILVATLTGCRRPERTFHPIEAYLGDLTAAELEDVQFCTAGCEEHQPVDRERWPGLLAGLRGSTSRSEPLDSFANWAWICGVTLESTAGRFFILSVQTATLELEGQTLLTVSGGALGADYSLFDGESVAEWCRAVESDLDERPAEQS